MIGRLTGRRAFDRLRADGVRRGRGPIRLVTRPTPTPEARIAFAIPRSVGSAVVRNRIKRRLRAVLVELDRETGGLAGADHLIRVTAPLDRWSHDHLRTVMADLLDVSPSRPADAPGDSARRSTTKVAP